MTTWITCEDGVLAARTAEAAYTIEPDYTTGGVLLVVSDWEGTHVEPFDTIEEAKEAAE